MRWSIMLEKIPTLFLYRAENIERKRRETGRESLLKRRKKCTLPH